MNLLPDNLSRLNINSNFATHELPKDKYDSVRSDDKDKKISKFGNIHGKKNFSLGSGVTCSLDHVSRFAAGVGFL